MFYCSPIGASEGNIHQFSLRGGATSALVFHAAGFRVVDGCSGAFTLTGQQAQHSLRHAVINLNIFGNSSLFAFWLHTGFTARIVKLFNFTPISQAFFSTKVRASSLASYQHQVPLLIRFAGVTVAVFS